MRKKEERQKKKKCFYKHQVPHGEMTGNSTSCVALLSTICGFGGLS